MTQSLIPDGFELFPKDNSFNDALSPLYFKVRKEGTVWGLVVEQQHSNPIGICHGAVLMALMDIALSASVCHSVGKYMGMPTISMSLDYLAPGRLNDWIQADVETLKITNTMGFAQGIICNQNNETLLRASGSFKLPKDLDGALGVSLSDLLAMKGIG